MSTSSVRTILRLSSVFIAVSSTIIMGADLTNNGWAGKLDGVKSWRLMNTANGLTPNQTWNAISATPNGDGYIVGCDHQTNTALYRMEAATEVLSLVGDAKSASEAAKNWLSTETAQKFHAPATLYNGRMYNATCDFSGSDSGWLKARGFHWYAYDISAKTYTDLSATIPGGVVAEHISIFATVLDSAAGVIYGISNPFGELYRYTIATNVTVKLGRPPAVTDTFPGGPYVLWMDSGKRVWFGYGKDAYRGKVYYYDQQSGFGEVSAFSAQEAPGNFGYGQWSLDKKTYYILDDRCRFYKFLDASRTFEYLGQIQVAAAYQIVTDAGFMYSRVFQVSADEKVAYLVNERQDWNAKDFSLFEWNFATQTGRRLCGLVQADDSVGYQSFRLHGGFDSWDGKGRFFIGSYSMSWDGGNTILTRLDPVRLKVALKLLPRLVTVSITSTSSAFQIQRDQSDTGALEVVVRADAQLSNSQLYKGYAKIAIPASAASVTVTPSQFGQAAGLAWKSGQLTVIPNGNTYVVGTSGSAALGTISVPHAKSQGADSYRVKKGRRGATIVEFEKADTFTLTLFDLNGAVVGQTSGRGTTVTIPSTAKLKARLATISRQSGGEVTVKLVR